MRLTICLRAGSKLLPEKRAENLCLKSTQKNIYPKNGQKTCAGNAGRTHLSEKRAEKSSPPISFQLSGREHLCFLITMFFTLFS